MKPSIVRTDEQRLWGLTVKTVSGVWVRFEPKEDGPEAGVREPRKPKKPAPAAAVAVEVDA